MISVIMATYNRADLIVNAIKSVQLQSVGDWELIVVADGCTDDTVEVVKRIASNDRRIRLIPVEKQPYYTHVRNIGIKEARGDLVCFRDDDSAWVRTFFEEMIKPHRNDDVAMTYCGRRQFVGVPFGEIDIHKLDILEGGTDLPIPVFQQVDDLINAVDVGDIMVKKTVLDGVGGFTEEKDRPGYCSDAVLMDDIAREYPNMRFVAVPHHLHYYFLDNKAKRKQMTLEKIEYHQEHNQPHPELEEEWNF